MPLINWHHSSAVELRTVNATVTGSNPVGAFAFLAQLEEHPICNRTVRGSTPLESMGEYSSGQRG